MATKKNIATGPKATLMKKSVAQLKAQAKKLKIKGFSTKKKEALVNSIMMAQARNKKGKTQKVTVKKPAAKRITRAAIGTNWGSMRGPKKTVVKPKVKTRKITMRGVDYARFENFGLRELAEAGKLLEAYANNNQSIFAYEYFGGPYGIQVGFNDMSGNVFLVDEDYNVLMWNGRELDLFISLPYSGEEGFYDDLMDINDELDQEDQEFLTDIYAGVYRK